MRLGQQPRGADGSSDSLVESVGARERDRNERRDEREVSLLDCIRERGGRRWKKSPVAELGPNVPGRRHLVENLRRRRRLFGRVEFERAP